MKTCGQRAGRAPPADSRPACADEQQTANRGGIGVIQGFFSITPKRGQTLGDEAAFGEGHGGAPAGFFPGSGLLHCEHTWQTVVDELHPIENVAANHGVVAEHAQRQFTYKPILGHEVLPGFPDGCSMVKLARYKDEKVMPVASIRGLGMARDI
jgi:hypothetical protein